jgi:hypothetical protein
VATPSFGLVQTHHNIKLLEQAFKLGWGALQSLMTKEMMFGYMTKSFKLLITWLMDLEVQ